VKIKLVILLIVITVVSGPLFSTEQILLTGAWAQVENLLDFDTPNELKYVVTPYAEYHFGRSSTNNLTGGMRLSTYSPYEIGSDIKIIKPSFQSILNYRFNERPNEFMQTGLTLFTSQTDFTGTFLLMSSYFKWYPYNKANEVTIHKHYLDAIEGLRLGFGINGKAFMTNLFEDADTETTVDVGLSGFLESGVQLGDHLWAHGYILLNVPSIRMPSTLQTYTVFANSQIIGTLLYSTEKIRIGTSLIASIEVNELLTNDSFFNNTSMDYNYQFLGEAGYIFNNDFYLYAGAELNGNKASLLDSLNVYIGAQYYLL